MRLSILFCDLSPPPPPKAVSCFLHLLDPPRKVVVLTPETNKAFLLRLIREAACNICIKTGSGLLASDVRPVIKLDACLELR